MDFNKTNNKVRDYLISNSFIINLDNFDLHRFSEECVYSKISTLTKKQHQLLVLLIEKYPEHCSKELIKERLWPNYNISPESIPQLVIKTRSALNDIEKSIIINTIGEGYKLAKVDIFNKNIKGENENLSPKKTRKLYLVNFILDITMVLSTFFIIKSTYEHVKINYFLFNLKHSTEIKITNNVTTSNLITFTNRSNTCIFNKSTMELSCVK